MKLRAAFLFSAISLSALFAQQPAPAAPPQTARQALLEMITGGQQAAMRHLTVEMQQSLKGKGKEFAPGLAVFDQIKAGGAAFQVFETGEVLLSFTEPGTNEKTEIHVESDDLNGDTDNIDLSFHELRDGVEQDSPYTELLSHFTLGFKRQENIWRLNEIALGIKVPVGDPAWLDKISKDMGKGGMVGAKASTGASEKPEAQMTAQQTVMMLGFAEEIYAQRHPEAGFTCSLAELRNRTSFGIDERIFQGEPSNGYKFSLSGCQGKPVESFHVIGEPVAPGAGAKAYCTDATRNVRSSDDGRGATCLSAGKTPNSAANTGGYTSWDPIHLSK
jgi:hypothetical protein